MPNFPWNKKKPHVNPVAAQHAADLAETAHYEKVRERSRYVVSLINFIMPNVNFSEITNGIRIFDDQALAHAVIQNVALYINTGRTTPPTIYEIYLLLRNAYSRLRQQYLTRHISPNESFFHRQKTSNIAQDTQIRTEIHQMIQNSRTFEEYLYRRRELLEKYGLWKVEFNQATLPSPKN